MHCGNAATAGAGTTRHSREAEGDSGRQTKAVQLWQMRQMRRPDLSSCQSCVSQRRAQAMITVTAFWILRKTTSHRHLSGKIKHILNLNGMEKYEGAQALYNYNHRTCSCNTDGVQRGCEWCFSESYIRLLWDEVKSLFICKSRE